MQSRLQITAARVKLNVEEVFEQWLDIWKKIVMNVIVVVRVRIRT